MTTDRPNTRGALRKYGEQGGNMPSAELAHLADRIKAQRDATPPEASAERRTAILDGLRGQIGGRDPETTGSLRDRLTHPDRIDGATGVVSLTNTTTNEEN